MSAADEKITLSEFIVWLSEHTPIPTEHIRVMEDNIDPFVARNVVEGVRMYVICPEFPGDPGEAHFFVDFLFGEFWLKKAWAHMKSTTADLTKVKSCWCEPVGVEVAG